MNIAVIFAGGVGKRMRSKDLPKQFLLVHGKPIIVHTLEVFQKHPEIDSIVVSCVSGWTEYMKSLVDDYRLSKVRSVVAGGQTGQQSIYNALKEADSLYGSEGVYVLIHDGVRPLIDAETISSNIEQARLCGSAITCVPAKETVIAVDEDGSVRGAMERSETLIARAPQTFRLNDVLAAHHRAIKDGRSDFIDTCTLMNHYGYQLATVAGRLENVKVTTPDDYYMLRAIYDAREDAQLVQGD